MKIEVRRPKPTFELHLTEDEAKIVQLALEMMGQMTRVQREDQGVNGDQTTMAHGLAYTMMETLEFEAED